MQATTSAKLDLTKQHLQILEYTDSLFTRWSLRRNTYLFKHLKPTLQIPLFILAQQRRISQITQSQSTLIEALKLSQFVQISQDNRTIKLLQLPTIRTIDQSTLLKIQKLVKQYIKNKTNQDKINIIKPLEYIISNKTDDGYYYLTIKQKKKDNKDILKQLIEHYIKQNKQKLGYSCQPLYDDIKQCIAKLRKNKREGNNSNSQYQHGYDNYNNSSKYNSKNSSSNGNESQINNPVYSRQNMMLMYPGMYYPMYNNMTGMMSEQMYGQQGGGKSYGVFIRKAVDSDQQQQPQSKIQDYASTNQQKQQQQLTSINQPARQQKPNNKQQLPSNTTNNNNSNKTNNRKYEYKNTPNSDNNKQQNNAKSKKQKYNNSNSNSNSNGNGNRNKVVLDDNDFPSIG